MPSGLIYQKTFYGLAFLHVRVRLWPRPTPNTPARTKLAVYQLKPLFQPEMLLLNTVGLQRPLARCEIRHWSGHLRTLGFSGRRVVPRPASRSPHRSCQVVQQLVHTSSSKTSVTELVLLFEVRAQASPVCSKWGSPANCLTLFIRELAGEE